jgi:ABC-type antimicrobial peptide transport system permease subunit
MPAVLSLFRIATMLILCALVSVLFGVYTTCKAARPDPIESLLYQ